LESANEPCTYGEIMELDKCYSEKIIRNIEQDKERVRNMLKLIEVRLEFWEPISKNIKEKFASLVVEAYYEIIKELLTAYLNLDALSSSNHECLIRYFEKQNPDLNFECEKIDELRKIRNKIDYRGFFVKKEFFDRNKLEYQHIIKLLKKLITDKLKE